MENFVTFIFSNTIVAFILLISVIIFFHEFGHFIAAKLFGIQVEEFSIGFGPQALSFKKGVTLYRINWLPLGGYVRFYGSDLEEEIPLQNQSKSFLHAKLYQRACVSFAGPFANFVLSFFVMFFLVWHGLPGQPAVISVLSNSVAQKAGLVTGDKIISVNEDAVGSWNELAKKISQSAEDSLKIEIERNSKILVLNIKPEKSLSETIYGTKEFSRKIGITPLFSIASLQPSKGDFFDVLGLKSGDIIHAVNDKKVKYLYEFYNAISDLTYANSDFSLAQKILNSSLDSNLTLKVTRNNVEKIIFLNFQSNEIKIWATQVIKHKFGQILWINTPVLSDLTIQRFVESKGNIQKKTVEAWQNCGIRSGFSIVGLNQLQPLNNVMQLYNFFETSHFESAQSNTVSQKFVDEAPEATCTKSEANSGAGTRATLQRCKGTFETRYKHNPQTNILVSTINASGIAHQYSCSIPLVEKEDQFNRKYLGIELPFVFVTVPQPLPPITIHAQNMLDAGQKALTYLWNQMTLIYKGLKMLFSGNIPLSNLGGPLAVASIAGDAAKAGFITFMLTMSLISVNIGMVNLLPLPALDGGYLLLNFVEAFYGKPLPKSLQVAVQRIGLFFLLGLFILVFYNDILRLFHL